ncbi:MAG: hypothetical protein MPW13_12840 [Candidatus Manganitrophus sp.]|nr:hypothetical protein [Candidatus Manganitrophus sp.]
MKERTTKEIATQQTNADPPHQSGGPCDRKDLSKEGSIGEADR